MTLLHVAEGVVVLKKQRLGQNGMQITVPPRRMTAAGEFLAIEAAWHPESAPAELEPA